MPEEAPMFGAPLSPVIVSHREPADCFSRGSLGGGVNLRAGPCFPCQNLQGESGYNPRAITLETSKCQREERRETVHIFSTQAKCNSSVEEEEMI